MPLWCLEQREATFTGFASPGYAAPSGFLSLLTLFSSRSRSGLVSCRWHLWGFPFRGSFLPRSRHDLSVCLSLLALSNGGGASILGMDFVRKRTLSLPWSDWLAPLPAGFRCRKPVVCVTGRETCLRISVRTRGPRCAPFGVSRKRPAARARRCGERTRDGSAIADLPVSRRSHWRSFAESGCGLVPKHVPSRRARPLPIGLDHAPVRSTSDLTVLHFVSC